ncbi:MAG TPA: SprT family zinc-dependent metalloprotease [Geminicoccaceae bacterium]|nr:SprT family zinc-dependent metalloprotease [Geminicoccaceae bacterium]
MCGRHAEPGLIETAVPYNLRRSARARRLRITVHSGGVQVVAPLRMRDADITAFVEQSRAWIDAKLAVLQRVLAAHPGSARLIDGSTILYRGQPVRLCVRGGARPQVREASGIEVTVPAALADADQEAVVERMLRRWLGWSAHNDALSYVHRQGPRHDLMPTAVRIKQHKRLWGSCTAKGAINLNWRLILAPPAVFEYVVVHELCHLREAHHQAPFWRLVGQILPGFEEQRRWLRANGHLLTLRPGDRP